MLDTPLPHSDKDNNHSYDNNSSINNNDSNITSRTNNNNNTITPPDNTDKIISRFLSKYQPHFRNLVCFYALQMLVAPVIESLVVVDRLLHVHEHPLVQHAHIQALFDECVSPRNLVLVAVKKNMFETVQPHQQK